MLKHRSLGLLATLTVALVLALPIAPAHAVGGGPGAIDTTSLRELAGDDGVKVEVNLSGALLKMLSGAMGGEEAEAAKMLSGLESVNVLVLNVDEGKADRAAATITKMGDSLAKKGWSAIARIQEEGETVQVLLHMDGDEAIDGLVVMVSERGEGELVFVNIVGRIDLEGLRHLAGEFDINGLEEALSAHTKGKGGDSKEKSKAKSKKNADDDDDDDDTPRRKRKNVF
jgi:hypothetical protein